MVTAIGQRCYSRLKHVLAYWPSDISTTIWTRSGSTPEFFLPLEDCQSSVQEIRLEVKRKKLVFYPDAINVVSCFYFYFLLLWWWGPHTVMCDDFYRKASRDCPWAQKHMPTSWFFKKYIKISITKTITWIKVNIYSGIKNKNEKLCW